VNLWHRGSGDAGQQCCNRRTSRGNLEIALERGGGLRLRAGWHLVAEVKEFSKGFYSTSCQGLYWQSLCGHRQTHENARFTHAATRRKARCAVQGVG